MIFVHNVLIRVNNQDFLQVFQWMENMENMKDYFTSADNEWIPGTPGKLMRCINPQKFIIGKESIV